MRRSRQTVVALDGLVLQDKCLRQGLSVARRHARIALREQLRDRLVLLVVLPFAKVIEADLAGGIRIIRSRPILILVRVPDGLVVVDDHRVGDAELLHLLAHVLRDTLLCELRRVYPYYDEATVLVLGVKILHVRQRVEAVVALEGPEVDEYDLALQCLRSERG